MLKCLDCSEDLDPKSVDERGVVRCDCGIKYDSTLLARVYPQRWEEARRARAFTRHGSTITIHDTNIAH